MSNQVFFTSFRLLPRFLSTDAKTMSKIAIAVTNFEMYFNYSIQYKKGKCHTNADAMSRNPIANTGPSINSLSA